MNSPVDVRDAFELWFSDGGDPHKAIARSGDGYRLMQAQGAWIAWKSAYAMMQDDLPRLTAALARVGGATSRSTPCRLWRRSTNRREIDDGDSYCNRSTVAAGRLCDGLHRAGWAVSGFTPGPWSLDRLAAVKNGRTVSIAVPAATSPETFANARLIAAAPELLAALQRIHAHGYTVGSDFDMVRAAIAKATGATP